MAEGGAAHRSDPGLTSSSHSLCGFREESVPPRVHHTQRLLLRPWLLLSPAPSCPPPEEPTSLCPSWFIFSCCLPDTALGFALGSTEARPRTGRP